MRYRIAWHNVVTGRSGHGEWRAITLEEAEADASELDDSGPEVRYWAEAEYEAAKGESNGIDA